MFNFIYSHILNHSRVVNTLLLFQLELIGTFRNTTCKELISYGIAGNKKRAHLYFENKSYSLFQKYVMHINYYPTKFLVGNKNSVIKKFSLPNSVMKIESFGPHCFKIKLYTTNKNSEAIFQFIETCAEHLIQLLKKQHVLSL